ncbi:MAG: precorrin-6y C5,15-methyltransferase (decarboxylating) subunit CbiE [Synergistaceae bacterium]|jgi:precorrin-6y C5,15-methyltransferase (decarboxylating) CbiE subunit|nr:precorrin-6y C5,15-methyltransferase (decarboxylating) subunit CbiE [Synergistaceae bacterium]
MITIVGAGPGPREYLTPEAARAIGASRVIVGGARVLDAAELPAGALRVDLPASGMADAVVGVLEEKSEGGDVTLLVSGDPGFYSLAKRVIERFGRDAVRVVPGISSIQIMAARICRSWAGAEAVTLHARNGPALGELAGRLRASSALVLLFGYSAEVKKRLDWLSSDEYLGSAWAALGWDLGLPEERIFEARRLKELRCGSCEGRLSMLWLEKNTAV